MRFFKLVQQHLDDEGGENESGNSRISEQDLESPFVEFLNKMRLENLEGKSSCVWLYTLGL